MKKLASSFLDRQFLKFLIIGGVNTASGTFFSFVYSHFLPANAAFVVAYLTSLMIAYFLNAYFVFKTKPDLAKYLKFCVSYLPNFAIQNLIVILVYNIMGLNRFYAFVLAAAIGIPVTFLCVKFFAFRQSKNNRELNAPRTPAP